MVKKIFIAMYFFGYVANVNAQLLRFGVKAGTNVSKVVGSSFKDKFEYGYHLGGVVQIHLTKKITLQPEVLFSQINTTLDSNYHNLYSSLSNNSYVKNINLKYLTIPLVLNYNLNKFVALQGGAQYGKLMQSSSTLLENGQSAFKNGDFAVLAGMQLNIGKIMLSGRYVVGLNTINDIDNRDSWKSQTAQLSIGFRF
jgi:hypothetical protein